MQINILINIRIKLFTVLRVVSIFTYTEVWARELRFGFAAVTVAAKRNLAGGESITFQLY